MLFFETKKPLKKEVFKMFPSIPILINKDFT